MPPPPCTVEHWSSSELEPAARLAYWREVAHNWVDARPLAPGDDLDASWTLMRSERCLFGTKRSTAYEMRTGSQHVPPNEDMVILSLLEAGEMQLAGANLVGVFNMGGAAVANYASIGVSSVQVAANGASTAVESAWVNLGTLAKADVYVAIVGQGGDGALDPTFGFVEVQFR